jgi:hypothetical protein
MNSGLKIKELEVYSANDVLNEIKSKVPNYSDGELNINSFSLYYKPYSLWTTKCQKDYSTEEAAEVGKNTG